MLLDEFFTLHKEAARAHGRVVHTALEGPQHFDDQGDDAFGGVVLATFLAFGQGELAEKVFVHVAEDVFAFQVQRLAVVVLAVEIGVGKMCDQVGQLVAADLRARKILVEHVLELLLVLALDGFHGVVDEPADAAHFLGRVFARRSPRQGIARRYLGAVAQGLPARFQRHPEHVFLGVVVAYFQLGGEVTLVIVGVVRRRHVVVMVRVLELLAQLFLPHFEGVGNVLEEDQAQHHVLVDRGVQTGAQLVRGGPQLFFELVEELFFDGVH